MKQSAIILSLCVAGLLAAQPATPPASGTTTLAVAGSAQVKLVPYLTFQVKDFGKLVVELNPDSAPLNVANVESLARKGFYNGLSFHRVIDGFMIQGGDPTGTGRGGPDYTVPGEFKLKNVRGAMAMARVPDQWNPTRASSSCQFYIVLQDQPRLDAGGYTVAGNVREGMDVVDKIGAVPVQMSEGGEPSSPVTPVIMEKVLVEMKPPTSPPVVLPPKFEGQMFMSIEFKDYGKVRVELFPNDAPGTVAGVESLARNGFYDGIPLRQVVPGFVVQGGDPNSSKGTGCCGRCPKVPSEFKRKNVKGAVGVGVASALERASASCEFYICLADLPKLDSVGYTVIGQVVAGMDVVNKIAKVKRDPENRPLKLVVIDKVTIEVVRPMR